MACCTNVQVRERTRPPSYRYYDTDTLKCDPIATLIPILTMHEGSVECDVSLSLARSSATGCSERVSYSFEWLYEAAVINNVCTSQAGRRAGWA